MRQRTAPGKGWASISLVLFLCFAAYVSGGMGLAQAAYSPTSVENEQAGQQAPGDGGRDSYRDTASRGGMTPAQSANPLQEEYHVQLLPAQEPRLPSLNATAYHAVLTLRFPRPLSELASRTGGHAPP